MRLLVARDGSSGLVATHTERVRLGLGHDLEAHGRISDAKVAATAKAVRSLCSQARARGASSLDVLVTAPGRQAENRLELIGALERAAAQRVRVLSADDEARLSFGGAVAASAPTARLVAVADLGGASTEIAIGPPESGPAWLHSVDLGALRLTARLLRGSPPKRRDVAAARAAVSEAFAELYPPQPGAALVVGGSARALGRIVGTTLGPEELRSARLLLAKRTPAVVADQFGIGRRRAPLLLGAALILAELQRRVVVPLEVADGGLREGALLVALEAVAA